MFLWRVAAYTLDTKENSMCHLEVEDPCCVLCNQEVESFSYIFFLCPMAKALWFLVCWGFRSNEVPLATSVDIINLILNPLEAICQAQDQWLVSIYLAHLKRFGLLAMSCSTSKAQYTSLLQSTTSIPSFKNVPPSSPIWNSPVGLHTLSWSTPLMGTIKINFYVVISYSNSALAVIA